MSKESSWGIEVVTEVRLQVRKERFRIHDVVVMRAGETIHRYPKVAPLICVEILSQEDTWRRLQQMIDDYSAMGCSNIWALDPKSRSAYYCNLDGFHKTDELAVPGTEIRFSTAEVFAVLG